MWLTAGTVAPLAADFYAKTSGSVTYGATATTILYDVVATGNAGWYNSATGRFTPPAARYFIYAAGGAGGGGSSTINLVLRKNGVNVASGQSNQSGGAFSQSTVQGEFDANGTDYFDIQGSGSPSVVGSAGYQWFGAFPVAIPTITPTMPNTLQLWSEKVCVGGETTMDVSFPYNARRIELEYVQRCTAAADPNLIMNILESGVVNAAGNYSFQVLTGVASAASSSGTLSQTQWNMSGGRQSAGTVKLFNMPSGAWYGTHVQNLITTTTRYIQVWELDFPPANIALTTGARLAIGGGQTFQAGSFFRAYVVP
jgi:hypothetical protein